jgi:hypothetical protein
MALSHWDVSLNFLTNAVVDHMSGLPGTSSTILPIQCDKLTWFCAMSFGRWLCKDFSTLFYEESHGPC